MDKNAATLTLIVVMTLTVLACIGVSHYLIDCALYVFMQIIVKMPLRYDKRAICLRTSDQDTAISIGRLCRFKHRQYAAKSWRFKLETTVGLFADDAEVYDYNNVHTGCIKKCCSYVDSCDRTRYERVASGA